MLNHINLSGRWALTAEGTIVPVTRMYDVLGEPTEDPAEAASFVAGVYPNLAAFGVAQFETKTIH